MLTQCLRDHINFGRPKIIGAQTQFCLRDAGQSMYFSNTETKNPLKPHATTIYIQRERERDVEIFHK